MMGYQMKFKPADDDSDPASYRALNPHQKLAHAILTVGLRDCYKLRKKQSRLAAKRWLLNREMYEYGATWWAEMAGLENYLEMLRKLLLSGKLDNLNLPWCHIWEHGSFKLRRVSK